MGSGAGRAGERWPRGLAGPGKDHSPPLPRAAGCPGGARRAAAPGRGGQRRAPPHVRREGGRRRAEPAAARGGAGRGLLLRARGLRPGAETEARVEGGGRRAAMGRGWGLLVGLLGAVWLLRSGHGEERRPETAAQRCFCQVRRVRAGGPRAAHPRARAVVYAALTGSSVAAGRGTLRWAWTVG